MKYKSGVPISGSVRAVTNSGCDKRNRRGRWAFKRSPKRRGEVVELAFMHKAIGLGFGVAMPYGDSECYDFILASRAGPGTGFGRVQVKSTDRFKKGGYLIGTCYFSAGGTKQAYTAEQIDFLV